MIFFCTSCCFQFSSPSRPQQCPICGGDVEEDMAIIFSPAEGRIVLEHIYDARDAEVIL